ncbi:MAG: M23 family metallopeptidase [Chitinophagales bacterium]
MLHVLRIIIIILISIPIYSQSFVYSKSYFRWPVNNKPGIVANFGELREGHWHMGLDVRTDHKVNMPVYAAADGYIARISVHPFGYGQAIYINHPNGLTTVYGHLNKFFPKLDSFVKAEQYKQESWELELEFTKDEFPVKKDQFIAYSGSTGSSQGPHVHFEIRDTKTERCINPLFFKLPVPDAVLPVFSKLAMYNRKLSVYDQSPVLFPVKKLKNKFSLQSPLIKTGFSKLSFGIGAYDLVSNSTNPNGIYSSEIFFDEKPLLEFVLDSMDYNETEYVNAHVDYKYKYNGGTYLQQLFKLPGDKGRAYRIINSDGTIILNDTNVHSVRIEIKDIENNSSELNFKLQFNNHLASLIQYNSNKLFSPDYVNVFELEDFEVFLPENCLYDSIQPFFNRKDEQVFNSVSTQFQFCDPSIPFHDKINIRMKPNVMIPGDLKNKIVIKRTGRENTVCQKAEWQKDWLAASFNNFGFYRAFIDHEPPTVNELGNADTIDLSESKEIVFYPKDNSGIKDFRAELDGQWLRFTNDKAAARIYIFDERCPYGIHQLKIKLEDIVGNVTEKEWWFKRYPYTPPKKIKASGKKKMAGGKKKFAVKRK